MPRQTPPAPARLAQQHARDAIDALGRLYRAPLASALTAMVIGITLALPAGLQVLLKNLDTLSYRWQESVAASLFLSDSLSEQAGRALTAQIAARPDVAAADYISRAQALAEFKRLSGFGDAVDAVDALAENPLPAVIAVRPEAGLAAAAVAKLVTDLGALAGVDQAKLDQLWLRRLYAALDLARRAVNIIALLLGLAVVFIVGNTIRLDIENRREEIAVMKLLGATDSFVRRPFLYTGFWYGALGGLLAWLLLSACLLALAAPVRRLAGLYGNQGGLAWPGGGDTLTLIGAGIALGWLGALISVGRRLRAVQPR